MVLLLHLFILITDMHQVFIVPIDVRNHLDYTVPCSGHGACIDGWVGTKPMCKCHPGWGGFYCEAQYDDPASHRAIASRANTRQLSFNFASDGGPDLSTGAEGIFSGPGQQKARNTPSSTTLQRSSAEASSDDGALRTAKKYLLSWKPYLENLLSRT